MSIDIGLAFDMQSETVSINDDGENFIKFGLHSHSSLMIVNRYPDQTYFITINKKDLSKLLDMLGILRDRMIDNNEGE